MSSCAADERADPHERPSAAAGPQKSPIEFLELGSRFAYRIQCNERHVTEHNNNAEDEIPKHSPRSLTMSNWVQSEKINYTLQRTNAGVANHE
jgi:hypothetical protein